MSKYRDFTKRELQWVKKFEAVMKGAPSTLFLFVGEGIYVYPLDESGQRYLKDNGAMDGLAPCASVKTKIEYDGGAF